MLRLRSNTPKKYNPAAKQTEPRFIAYGELGPAKLFWPGAKKVRRTKTTCCVGQAAPYLRQKVRVKKGSYDVRQKSETPQNFINYFTHWCTPPWKGWDKHYKKRNEPKQ